MAKRRKIPRGSIHTFMRLAMTRLTFSCGIKQSTTEFVAQAGPLAGILAVIF